MFHTISEYFRDKELIIKCYIYSSVYFLGSEFQTAGAK